jgi:hypothetical protein
VRFDMLETIRAFARTQLDASAEADTIRTRHASAFLALAGSLFPQHAGTEDGRLWLDRLEADDANVRKAVRWSIEVADAGLALGLVGYLWRYWVHGGRLVEGRDLARAAMALSGADASTEERMWALSASGSLAYWSNDLQSAGSCYLEQLELARALGSGLGEADAWYNLLFVRRTTGDDAGADQAAHNARRILTELGEDEILDGLWASLLVMSAPFVLGDPDSELPRLRERIAAMERSTSPAMQAVLPDLRAVAALAGGDMDEAARQLVVALRVALEWRRVGDAVAGLALAATMGVGRMDPVLPATIFGAVETATERYGISGPRWTEVVGSGVAADPLGSLAEALGDEALEQALEQGRQMTLDEIVAFIEQRAEAGLASAG